MTASRRTFVATAGALAATTALATTTTLASTGQRRRFPKGFLWGTATAGHQIEGNNTASDLWLCEHVKPTLFREPSADAISGFELWQSDLDLVRGLGLNTYRFSLEWSRIEPEAGQFSSAMLDHYARIIDGCHARSLAPVVTFNHFTVPRWFAAQGGWTSAAAAELFARYCGHAAQRLAGGMAYATTLNEPNMMTVIGAVLPPPMIALVKEMNAAAGRACGSGTFKNAMIPEAADIAVIEANLIAAHRAGRAAIKAARSTLPVGVSLTMTDDQAVGSNSLRDARRALFYGSRLAAAKGDDFLGVQNYARSQWTDSGNLPPPKGAQLNGMGNEIYAPSLAGAVRYAHEASGLPILVSEHGLTTTDDTLRAAFITEALTGLQQTIADGVPVLGYIHWTLADNFEWIFGYTQHFGLCSVDRTTFKRTPKPSASVLGAIAGHNSV